MADHHDNRDDNREGEFEGRTYLYIRDHPADDGTEPLPAALPAWLSPDITIIKPNGTRGGEAVAGQPNQIEVFVTNAGGIDAIGAYVDVFLAGPTTGWTPTTAALVGGGPLDIPGYNRRAMTLTWTPLAAEAGHRCVLARVSLIIPPDTYADNTIFDVVGDRHIAQRNIHVLALGGAEQAQFMFQIVNPDPEPAEFRVFVNELRDEVDLEPLRMALGCGFVRFGQEPLGDVALLLDDQRLMARPAYRPALDPMALRQRSDSARAKRDRESAGRETDALELKLDAGASREATLMIGRNPYTRRGDVHAVQVVQVDTQGQVRGGLVVVVQH